MPINVCPFPSDWMPCCPTDRLESACNLLETAARQLVESKIPSNQKRAIGRVAKRGARGRRNPLLGSKRLETFPVVTEDTVLRAHPNEAHPVLIDLPDSEVIEAFFDTKAAEIVFLSVQDLGCQHEKCKYNKSSGDQQFHAWSEFLAPDNRQIAFLLGSAIGPIKSPRPTFAGSRTRKSKTSLWQGQFELRRAKSKRRRCCTNHSIGPQGPEQRRLCRKLGNLFLFQYLTRNTRSSIIPY